MIPFISLTNAYNDQRVALNMANVIGVFEQPNGECVIEFRSTSTDENTITVKETYDEIGAMIYDYNQIRT